MASPRRSIVSIVPERTPRRVVPARSSCNKPHLRSPEYAAFVQEMKLRVQSARTSAARAVNRELVLLYWDIGRAIVEKQQAYGWGESVVEDLSRDLRRAFPELQGFSARSLWYMRRLFVEYSHRAILQQAAAELRTSNGSSRPSSHSVRPVAAKLQQLVAEIPWGHHIVVLDKVPEASARLYYLQSTARFGWSRNVLLHQIKARAYERSRREGKLHNFPQTLSSSFALQAEEALKSSYSLEFLGVNRTLKERELEGRLIDRLKDSFSSWATVFVSSPGSIDWRSG